MAYLPFKKLAAEKLEGVVYGGNAAVVLLMHITPCEHGRE